MLARSKPHDISTLQCNFDLTLQHKVKMKYSLKHSVARIRCLFSAFTRRNIFLKVLSFITAKYFMLFFFRTENCGVKYFVTNFGPFNCQSCEQLHGFSRSTIWLCYMFYDWLRPSSTRNVFDFPGWKYLISLYLVPSVFVKSHKSWFFNLAVVA